MHHDADDMHGHDELHKDGTPGDDVLTGGPGNHILHGGAGNDTLWGGEGDDELGGGAGDDQLIGGPGADALDGGPGMDIASYTGSTRGVRVDLGTSFSSGGDDAPVRGGDAEGDSLTSIESIWGSNFADLLIGSRAANYLFGNGGNDRIWGGGGNDLLRGGDDDDVLGMDEDAAATDPMRGSENGNDTLYGDAGFDFLGGGMGNDMLFGGMDDDTLQGGDGDDMLEGGMGADHLMGGMGMDTASYTMSGMAVTVNLSVAATDATAMNPRAAGGDADGDMIGTDVENVRGSMHDDMLTGDDMGTPVPAVLGDNPATTDVTETDHVVTAAVEGFGNKLFGNMGNDMLKGGKGEDTLHGGKGDDTLYGGDDNDKLMGEMGDDALKGNAGDDTLIGGEGADVLLGGGLNEAGTAFMADAGMDTADYSGSEMGVTVDLGRVPRGQTEGKAGSIGKGGDAEGDVLHSIENLTGSAHTDLLKGGDGRNVLMGGAGDDWDDPMTTGSAVEGGLFGGDGNDLLVGGAGMDWLDGQGGMDDVWGGDGDDMLKGGADNDRPFGFNDADPPVASTLNLEAAELFLEEGKASVDDFDLDGEGAGTDTLDARRAGLFGGKGDDTLDGGTGDDWLDGGEGDDTFIYDVSDLYRSGGAGTDTIDASGLTGTDGVTINLGADDEGTSADAAAQALVKSIENATGSDNADFITGGMDANMLMGGKGADTILGMGGKDTLVGGAGDDTLNGGAGADTFVFAPGDGVDTIAATGFSTLHGDKIDLSAYGLTEDELQALIAQQGDVGATVTLYLGDGTATVEGLEFENGGTIVINLSGRDATLGLDADDFII